MILNDEHEIRDFDARMLLEDSLASSGEPTSHAVGFLDSFCLRCSTVTLHNSPMVQCFRLVPVFRLKFCIFTTQLVFSERRGMVELTTYTLFQVDRQWRLLRLTSIRREYMNK